MGTRGSFPGEKQQGHEDDHSPPSSAEVKNAWSNTSTSSYVLTEWFLLKHIIRHYAVVLNQAQGLYQSRKKYETVTAIWPDAWQQEEEEEEEEEEEDACLPWNKC